MKAALRFVYFLYRRSHQFFVYMYFLFTIVYIKLAKILERLHGKENVPKIESCIKVCTFISRDGLGPVIVKILPAVCSLPFAPSHLPPRHLPPGTACGWFVQDFF